MTSLYIVRLFSANCWDSPSGGCMSAQGASLELLHRERALAEHTLPSMVRYRNDYLLLLLRVRGDYSSMEEKLHDAMCTLSSVIGMTLKIKNLGPVIPFLEATLTFDSVGLPDLRLRKPTFSFKFGMCSPHQCVWLRRTPPPQRDDAFVFCNWVLRQKRG